MDGRGTDSTLGAVLTWLLIAGAAFFALKLSLAVIGMVFGLAGMALHLLPVIMVVWFGWLIIRRFNRRGSWDRP